MDLSSILPSGLFPATDSGEPSASTDTASSDSFSQIFGQTLQESLSGSGATQQESGNAVGLLGQSLALGIAQSLVPTSSAAEASAESAEAVDSTDSDAASSETATADDSSAASTASSDAASTADADDAISAAASAWSDERLSGLMATQALEKKNEENG
ncbi:hypothetical protein [Marinobacter sp. JSM 1782161]|uniref:hypothetical protein n=1 Tax=Marinobacter sp. JSM 1782161 TaxID=2685906 RepID=UPI00140384D8|nr:hypothetical protein [Marinobacter sp. JSM 1782161]